MIPFELKLKESLEGALSLNNEFSLIIDADIIVRKGFLKRVRGLCKTLEDHCSGFGIKVFDYFYDSPKFRGIHIYRTEFIPLFLSQFPLNKNITRPETTLKTQVHKIGHPWKNHHSMYVGGLHDFYQFPADIAYKYFIRSFRSQKDLNELKEKFLKKEEINFKAALMGLNIGAKSNFSLNDKVSFQNQFRDELASLDNEELPVIPKNIDFHLISKLYKNYGLSNFFIKSL